MKDEREGEADMFLVQVKSRVSSIKLNKMYMFTTYPMVPREPFGPVVPIGPIFPMAPVSPRWPMLPLAPCRQRESTVNTVLNRLKIIK